MYGYLKDWPAAIQMQPAILPLAGCHSAERCTGELEVCREQRTDRPRALPLWLPDTQPFPAHTRVSSERGESGRNIAKNNSSNNLIESFIWIRDYQCVVIIHLYEDMWWLSLDILQISTQQQMAHWQTLIPCRTESLTDNLTTQYHQANQTWTRPAWKQTKAANSGSPGRSKLDLHGTELLFQHILKCWVRLGYLNLTFTIWQGTLTYRMKPTRTYCCHEGVFMAT